MRNYIDFISYTAKKQVFLRTLFALFSTCGNNVFGYALRNFRVAVRLHRVLTTALRFGTHIGRIAKHFGKRNLRINLLRARKGIHSENHAAAGVQVTDNVAIYSSGTVTVTFMIGSMMTGSALRIASLNAIEPAILNAISEESTS